ncbi:hypothetical protein Tco_1052913 [Tanacetum coccineum]
MKIKRQAVVTAVTTAGVIGKATNTSVQVTLRALISIRRSCQHQPLIILQSLDPTYPPLDQIRAWIASVEIRVETPCASSECVASTNFHSLCAFTKSNMALLDRELMRAFDMTNFYLPT